MILLFSHSPSVEAFFVRDPSQAMRTAGREPTGGEIPVELTSRQPFDDFPQQSGVSRTNRIVSLYKVKRHTPSKSTGLTVKGNKKRAEKMLSEARAAKEAELEARARLFKRIEQRSQLPQPAACTAVRGIIAPSESRAGTKPKAVREILLQEIHRLYLCKRNR